MLLSKLSLNGIKDIDIVCINVYEAITRLFNVAFLNLNLNWTYMWYYKAQFLGPWCFLIRINGFYKEHQIYCKKIQIYANDIFISFFSHKIGVTIEEILAVEMKIDKRC